MKRFRNLLHTTPVRTNATRAGAERRTLLYVSPIVPALHGNGLAMRAAQVLLALASRYRVTLLVFPRYASPSGRVVPDEIRQACGRIAIGSLGPHDEPVKDEHEHEIRPGSFDIVHVFRLGTIPFAEPFIDRDRPGVGLWLDLDDIESITHRRIAALYRLNGDEAKAREEDSLAGQAEHLEIAALGRFDRVFLASPGDLDRLPVCDVASVETLPNVLPRSSPLPPPPRDQPFTLLFVGTLDYFPNADGLRWFAGDVLPIIQRNAAQDIELRVVGTGWSRHFPRLSSTPGVHLAGPAPDLRTHYERANAVVVPLRAGGGTRIKVIEAFGLRRPVVGTTIGFEGIDVRDGEHVLIADTAETFAAACLRIIDMPHLGDTLAERAFQLAQARYSTEHLAAIVAGWP